MVIRGRWLIESPSESVTYIIPDMGGGSESVVVELLRTLCDQRSNGTYSIISVRYVESD